MTGSPLPDGVTVTVQDWLLKVRGAVPATIKESNGAHLRCEAVIPLLSLFFDIIFRGSVDRAAGPRIAIVRKGRIGDQHLECGKRRSKPILVRQ